MAYNSPTSYGYRPYPAASASYRALSQPTPWPTLPVTNNNVFTQPARANNIQPITPAYARPAAPIGGGHWYSSLMNPPHPPQSMVISLNAPKLTSEEARKNFWMKVGGTTLSIVAGLGIFAYFGMKILPHKIVQEMISQAHKSALNSLTLKSLETLITKINHGELIEDQKVLKTIKEQWGSRKPKDIYRNKKEFTQFKAEIEQHIPTCDILALITQDVVSKAATPELTQETTNLVVGSVSNLLNDPSNKEGIKNYAVAEGVKIMNEILATVPLLGRWFKCK